ncbi:ParB/RepB/Spo0J family partition protein [Capilliphycus salinus ALCB114379]|uniref:ParB/RepB/Spo0J family partition protein n=1 Tax=Capilliphycus salinus TaxID=2768948 RepID=UPI0039A44281
MVKRRTVSNFIAELPSEPESSLPLGAIVLSNFQPRRYFDPTKQSQLEVSIKEHGILEPLVVRSAGDGKYELVAGERHYRAAKNLGMESVPVVIRNLTDEQAMTLALVENLIREDLNPVEETEGILALLGIELKLRASEVPALLYRLRNKQSSDNVITGELQTVQSVFESVGMSWESFVANRLPLIKLPQEILDVLREGKIEYTKAKAIAKVKDEANRQQLLAEVVENNLSLTQIKERIKDLQSAPQPQDAPQTQIKDAYHRLNKSKLWEKSPKKWQRVQTWLEKIEAILEEE